MSKITFGKKMIYLSVWFSFFTSSNWRCKLLICRSLSIHPLHSLVEFEIEICSKDSKLSIFRNRNFFDISDLKTQILNQWVCQKVDENNILNANFAHFMPISALASLLASSKEINSLKEMCSNNLENYRRINEILPPS